MLHEHVLPYAPPDALRSSANHAFAEWARRYAEHPYPDVVPWGAAPAFSTYTQVIQEESTGINSLTIASPGGSQNNLLIAHGVVDGSEVGFFSPDSTGWNEIVVEENSFFLTQGLWWKLIPASDSTGYTWSWELANRVAIMSIIRITGNKASATPIVVHGTTVGASTAATCPDVTALVTDALILRFDGSDFARIPSSTDDIYPAGHTGAYAVAALTPNSVSARCAYKTQSTAGPTGTATMKLSQSDQWVATTVVVRPVVAAAKRNRPQIMMHGL